MAVAAENPQRVTRVPGTLLEPAGVMCAVCGAEAHEHTKPYCSDLSDINVCKAQNTPPLRKHEQGFRSRSLCAVGQCHSR